MDEHDEALEAIPWERFASVEQRIDTRLLVALVAVLALVGAGAFALRRSTAPVAAANPAVATSVSMAPMTTTTTTLPLGEGLWAEPTPDASLAGSMAERFLAGLLLDAGIDVASIRAVGPPIGTQEAQVVVWATARGADGSPLRLAIEATVGSDGTIVSWKPVEVEAVRIRTLTDGAVPPPDVLDGLIRTAALWGTAEEVVRSGIDGSRWWAEFSVRLADGSVVPLVVWEDYPG